MIADPDAYLPDAYLRAFERNCPDVRLTADEREELRRLFIVLIQSLLARTPA